MSPSTTISLSDALQMPVIGLGTFMSSSEEVSAAVEVAIMAGFRHIDTASLFGHEETVGIAIKNLINNGVVKREELFISARVYTHELVPELLEGRLRYILYNLKIDYVDLFIASQPPLSDNDKSDRIVPRVSAIWRQFDRFYEAGMAKAVGVSNWNYEWIVAALNLRITPVHYCQVELRHYAGAIITFYGTLEGTGRMYVTTPSGQKIYWGPPPDRLENDNVIALAKKYKKTPNQILFRFVLHLSRAKIPKAIKSIRIEEEFNVFDFVLTPNEIAKIRLLRLQV